MRSKESGKVRYAYGVTMALLLGGTAFSLATGQAGAQVPQNAPGTSALAPRPGAPMATGLIVGESLMGVVYAFAVAGAEKAGSADSANVLALVPEYSSVMAVSIVVFALAIAALYFWTKGRASVAPVPGDDAIVQEATYR